MKRLLSAALGLAALLATGSALAQLTVYEWDGFRGRSFTANQTTPNFAQHGFDHRASSAIVERGRWEVCERPGFDGRCVVLSPGQYPSLATMGMNDRISSVRRAPRQAAAYAPPPPPPAPPYRYYPRHGERLYTANVVAVRAVVGPPEQRCWVEQQQVATGQPNVPGAILGGILGGVLGHQIGSGTGQDVATAVGAVGGAAVGANVGRGSTYTQNVQKCAAVPGSAQPSYWDVTYVFRGREYRAQLTFPPGPTITVNGRGEPRV
ncbi:MAG: beta/gamma crystallin family protein [Betaproteobacteria bacterium]|jgi:uncharacterized protein YcfJ|nr:beta/gamma crystallin family protein [Betaproteobacteria bacterium]